VSEHDDVQGRDRWEETDDWFALPEPGEPRSDDAVEENWLEEDVPVERPRRGRLALDRRQLAVGGGAVVVVVLLLLWLTGAFGGGGHPSSSGPPTTTRPPSTTTVQTTARPPLPPPATTLRPGSSGAQVKRLQRALARLGYSTGHVDGSYGPATVAALKRFQQANGLQPDGVLGPKTLRLLKAKLSAG
jgi:putative peptidoglycan binding protein